MQGFETIINSIIKLGIAMLVGFVCIKTGYITKEQNNGLSKVIVRVTLDTHYNFAYKPLNLIQKIEKFDLCVDCVDSRGCVSVCSRNGHVKISKMDKSRAIMHRCMTCFGNVVFMAFPLIQALYGAEGLYMRRFMNLQTILVFGRSAYQMKSIEEKKNRLWEV